MTFNLGFDGDFAHRLNNFVTIMDKMLYYGAKTAAVVFALTMLVSCSLLKFTLSTGEEPMPKEEMNTRVMTRGFYYELSNDIAETADSIAKDAPMAVQVAATRWKIRSTRVAVTAAMQGIPDVALADLWILCRRMNTRFGLAPDSLLFFDRTPIARATAERLDHKAEDLAREVLTPERFALMQRFVEVQSAENPATETDASNTTYAWMQFLKAEGVEPNYTTGTVAEVLADVNDRVSGQTQQISNSLGWSKDIIALQLQQDSMRHEIGAQLDSLERNFNRMVVVAEHIPEISDKMMQSVGDELSRFVSSVDSSVDNLFYETNRQRNELQSFITREREAMITDLRSSADEVVQNALDAVPGVVGEVVFYVVFGVLLLLGVPFGLGFWLGGVRQRARERRENEKK